MSSFRHAASSIVRIVACAAGTALALVIALYVPVAADAAEAEPTAVEAVVAAPKAVAAQVSAELAVCPGQTFLQPFTELGDSNYYTLVENSESAATGEGWELLNGASVVEGTRPDGSRGGVFDLPPGAVAISPPTCVTLLYPTARSWVQRETASGTQIKVAVLYSTMEAPKNVASLTATLNGGWELSAPFNVKPQLGGREEGVREVRFAYANLSARGDFHVAGLYVDPRLTH